MRIEISFKANTPPCASVSEPLVTLFLAFLNKIETINRCEKRNMKCFQNIIKVLLPINNMTLSYILRYFAVI